MKKDWCAEEFRCMVALGESTTAGGWSTAPDRCWVPLLGELINDFQNCSCLAKRTRQAERTSPRWRDESVLKSDYGF